MTNIISRNLLAKLLKFVYLDKSGTKPELYDAELYQYVELEPDEASELSMLQKELKEDMKNIKLKD